MNLTRKDLLYALAVVAIVVAYATFGAGNIALLLLACLALDLIPTQDRVLVRVWLPLAICMIGYGVYEALTRGQLVAIPVAVSCVVIIMGGALLAEQTIGLIKVRRNKADRAS
jgi:hypothetical protein